MFPTPTSNRTACIPTVVQGLKPWIINATVPGEVCTIDMTMCARLMQSRWWYATAVSLYPRAPAEQASAGHCCGYATWPPC